MNTIRMTTMDSRRVASWKPLRSRVHKAPARKHQKAVCTRPKRSVAGLQAPRVARKYPHHALLFAGPTVEALGHVLHRVPVVGQVLAILDGFFSFFSGGQASEQFAQMRRILDHEANLFTQKFENLIHAVTDTGDLELLAGHINKAASTITDNASLQRIAMRLQSSMAVKALSLGKEAQQKIGAQMKASVDALASKKDDCIASGERAIQETVQAGQKALDELSDTNTQTLGDKAQRVEAIGKTVARYIQQLEALRDTVLKNAEKDAESLSDLSATAHAVAFSKRASSQSSRQNPRGTRTTTVVRPKQNN